MPVLYTKLVKINQLSMQCSFLVESIKTIYFLNQCLFISIVAVIMQTLQCRINKGFFIIIIVDVIVQSTVKRS